MGLFTFRIEASDTDKELAAELRKVLPNVQSAMASAKAANEAIKQSHSRPVRSEEHIAAQEFFVAEIGRIGLAAVLADKENLSAAAWELAAAMLLKKPGPPSS